LLVVWLILLLPWIFVALDSLFIADSDHSLKVHIFLSSVWSYPIAVGIVAIFRKKAPLIALLPCLNIPAIVFMS
jgi:hypothetical protein